MFKLNSTAKKVLDPDTQLLVEYGVYEKDLSVSQEKRGFVLAFLIDKFKSEIADEIRSAQAAETTPVI